MPYHCLNNGHFDCNGEPDWSVNPHEIKVNESQTIVGGVCGNNWNECPKIKERPVIDMVTTGVHVTITLPDKKVSKEEKTTRIKKEKKEKIQGSLF